VVGLSPESVSAFLGVEVLRRHAVAAPLPEDTFLRMWKDAVPSGLPTDIDLVKVGSQHRCMRPSSRRWLVVPGLLLAADGTDADATDAVGTATTTDGCCC
jgi:hypothetical protein